ncbi:hypothetical protein HZA33_03240 [Candidatus Pacearchaeota archaeon]|nr:hypothetical protein [Candidatus Pacearchaeota archaeon]
MVYIVRDPLYKDKGVTFVVNELIKRLPEGFEVVPSFPIKDEIRTDYYVNVDIRKGERRVGNIRQVGQTAALEAFIEEVQIRGAVEETLEEFERLTKWSATLRIGY